MLRTFLRRLMKNAGPSLLPQGTPLPAFELLDHHGAPVRSTDLAGRRFVLWFYPKADTPG